MSGRPAPHRPRAAAFAVAALLLTGLGACAPAERPATGDPRPVVLATTTVLADIASEVAGDDVVVHSLVDPGTEIHGYEPSPDDLRRAAAADLVVANGLGLEGWVDALLAPLDVERVVLGEAVGLDPTTSRDPHAWMSPELGAQYAELLGEAFAELDPENADAHRARSEEYAARVRTAGADLRERLADVPQARRVLVTCEGAFTHLGREADLRTVSLWPVNAERQATPRRVAAVIDVVRETGVPAVFCESTVAPTAAEQVARETGARFAGILHVDSLSGPDGAVPTYLDLLRHDADLIATALAEEGTP